MKPQTALNKMSMSPELTDYSGFALPPLPKDHWIYNQDGSLDSGPPPMPFRMGCSILVYFGVSYRERDQIQTLMKRDEFADKIREAVKYAVRASTMCGKDMNLDPDAIARNTIVGMLGYWTADGLSDNDWENPPDQQRSKVGGDTTGACK
jgi:hypothetical protein